MRVAEVDGAGITVVTVRDDTGAHEGGTDVPDGAGIAVITGRGLVGVGTPRDVITGVLTARVIIVTAHGLKPNAFAIHRAGLT